ncbi:hypothetical protein JOE51_006795 [Bradyrhizobium japonicum]|uniref:hypothetical protein n=1 Tax=Bradyrhizobium diazoefficiens TaxID=1355477 RepID=UPI001B5F5309|nr:hypothetical protein [Bradyrhizobium japonicum]
MATNADEIRQVKTAVAVLTVCLVRASEKQDPGYEDRFLELLRDAYYHFRDNADGEVISILETLSWTRTMLTGWNNVTGQSDPFLK